MLDRCGVVEFLPCNVLAMLWILRDRPYRRNAEVVVLRDLLEAPPTLTVPRPLAEIDRLSLAIFPGLDDLVARVRRCCRGSRKCDKYATESCDGAQQN
jgi:hypothetical protein